ncbi:hypothetical protein OPV22_008832 [Ensete ventricosum]|uniref:Uncharacterized protein n=1 Tax=Ensete ventricosum TaxID=4639 RepID=A0AAV8PPZ4_ENSVE|nr:hypothetical protein OPV22_008832 [Ensete ventricosum]
MPAFIPLKRYCCFFLTVLWLSTTYGKSGVPSPLRVIAGPSAIYPLVDFNPDGYDVYCDDGNRLAVPVCLVVLVMSCVLLL